MNATKMTYTTIGAVRGGCGHQHRTLRAAVECLARDQAGCKSQGGYSDRSVYYGDGLSLDDADFLASQAIKDGRL